MAQERENPFRPGPGKVPPHRAGHEVAVRHLTEMMGRIVRRSDNDMVVLYGPRGTGKTALLNEIHEKGKEMSVRVSEMNTGDMTGEPKALGKLLPPPRRFRWPLVRKLMAMFPFGGGAEVEFGDSETDSVEHVLRRLLRDPLVVIVDEAHTIPPDFAKVLLQVAQRCVRDRLPLLLVLAGTPGIRARLRGINASFWERARRLKIGRLETRDAARKALSVPVEEAGMSFAEEALELLVDESQNYPFFIQFLGEQTWEAAMARDPATSSIELRDAQAGVRLADEQRRDFYKERRDEAETRKILPEAEAVSKAFFELGGDGVLSEAQLENAVRPALSEGRTVKVATDELSALGLVWEPRDLVWEQGIPSLCTYLAENAKTG